MNNEETLETLVFPTDILVKLDRVVGLWNERRARDRLAVPGFKAPVATRAEVLIVLLDFELDRIDLRDA